MQTIIVIIIVCLAVAYLANTFFRKPKGQNGCGCGCASCSSSLTCDEDIKKEGPA